MTETSSKQGIELGRSADLAFTGGATAVALSERPATTAAKRSEPTAPRPHEEFEALATFDWGALEPQGFYARCGRRILNAALLVVTMPLALVLAFPIGLVNWMIFRSARRILFKQPRIGHQGRVFWIYKFRTMREAANGDFSSWKKGQDRLRVTRFGRFLRNTHLDELPQFINIIRGEMDFIGPRPEMIEIDRWACERIERFRERNALLPGITGYAQITQGYAGMDETGYDCKLVKDLYYKNRLSLRLDLLILFRTLVWMLRGRGWQHRPAADTRKPSGALGGESSAA